MIYHEMDNYLQIKPTNKNCRKRTSFWNTRLNDIWSEMKYKEKSFKKNRTNCSDFTYSNNVYLIIYK